MLLWIVGALVLIDLGLSVAILLRLRSSTPLPNHLLRLEGLTQKINLAREKLEQSTEQATTIEPGGS